MINKLFKNEIFIFIVIAAFYNVVSTLLNWGMLYIGIHYLICNAVSYAFGVLLAYFLNTKYVFKKNYDFSGFIKFVSVYGSNFIITMILTYVLVDILKINVYIAPIITTIISSGYNYLMSKFFVYKEDKD